MEFLKNNFQWQILKKPDRIPYLNYSTAQFKAYFAAAQENSKQNGRLLASTRSLASNPLPLLEIILSKSTEYSSVNSFF